MAAVNVAITGVLIDLYGRVISGPVKLVGELVRSDVGIGGGPIIPPPESGGGDRPGLWPPGSGIDLPGHPLPDPQPHPEHPIVLPPDQTPPGLQPPEVPPPGTVTKVPGNFPVSDMVPPAYMTLNYPGVGPVTITPPSQPAPAQG